MIIANSRRFIFIHVMKCAGTSIKLALQPHLGWNDIHLDGSEDGDALSHIYRRRFGLFKHASAAAVRDVVGEALWRDYVTFATVRSPYDRLASTWRFLGDGIVPHVAAVGFPAAAGPAARMAWLDSPACPDGWRWRWPLARAFLREHGRPGDFSAWLRAPETIAEEALRSQSALLADPRDGRLLPALVVRHDELPHRWPEVAARIGLSGVPLGWANATARRPAAALFAEPADVMLVAERYADDFVRFGFTL